jgi:hypothetical protein
MASAARHTWELDGRVYDIEFTPPILRESERALERPLFGIVRAGHGLTLEQTEQLLWVQVRRQNRRLTPQVFQRQLDAHWATGPGYLAAALVLIQAFNVSNLPFRADDGDGDAAENGRPPMADAAPESGISSSPAASTDGSIS